jgi:hypothetical protein
LRARIQQGARIELHGQAFAHILDADAVIARDFVVGNRIAHAQCQGSVRRRHGDAHHDRTLVTRQPMDHRIFDQRLQNEARDPNRGNFVGRRQLHGEPICKSPLLQFEVQPHELDLVGQAGEVALSGTQQPAQQIRELHHHGLRALRIPFDVAANRVQEIEQRMRRQLHAQCREAGGGPFALERRDPQLGVSKARVQRETRNHGQSESIGGNERHETGHPQRQEGGVQKEGTGHVVHRVFVPFGASQEHLRDQHGRIRNRRKGGSEDELQRNGDQQRTPLDAQRCPKRDQYDGQQEDVLQDARIPFGEQGKVQRAADGGSHAVGIKNIRQRHIQPEQADDGEELPKA